MPGREGPPGAPAGGPGGHLPLVGEELEGILPDLLLHVVAEFGVVPEELLGRVLPWPMRSSPMENQEPLFWMMFSFTAKSTSSPYLEMPSPYMMSNSASRKGGYLVLYHLGPGAVADDLGAGLDGLDAAHLNADGGVELQGPCHRW